MASKRQNQVAELIRRNFGMVLQSEGGYIYGFESLVTVTSVDVSPDLSIAKIYISVYNSDDKEGIIAKIEENHYRLKKLLISRIRKQIRRMPDVRFFLDDTFDEMERIDELFKKIHEDKEKN